MSKTQDLYGGAMSTIIPSYFVDASTFRQVPDTQEVFVSTKDINDSIIIDLLESVPEKDLSDILEAHMEEITRLNDGAGTIIDEVETLNCELGSSGIMLFKQAVKKFGKSNEQENVYMFMAVIRLSKVKTDVVICYNTISKDYDNGSRWSIVEEMVKQMKIRNWELFV